MKNPVSVARALLKELRSGCWSFCGVDVAVVRDMSVDWLYNSHEFFHNPSSIIQLIKFGFWCWSEQCCRDSGGGKASLYLPDVTTSYKYSELWVWCWDCCCDYVRAAVTDIPVALSRLISHPPPVFWSWSWSCVDVTVVVSRKSSNVLVFVLRLLSAIQLTKQ